MQIVVKGIGRKSLVPTSVKLEVKFVINSNNYDNTLEKGSNAIKNFIKVIESHNIKSENFISDGFVVSERTEFNSTLGRNIFSGYTYQNEGYLILDYDNDLLVSLITDLSRLKYYPLIKLSYEVDNTELYDLAYKDAILKANNISKSANLTLKDCLKIEMSSNNVINSSDYFNPRNYLKNNVKRIDSELSLDCTFVA